MKHIDLLNHLILLKYYGFRFKIEMSGAYLRGANLKEADLRRADFEEADLREANLEGAYLKWTNLSLAYLTDANLKGAYLEGADIEGSDLEGANLEGSNLEGANLDFSCWPLHCDSAGVKIDERIAKQLLAHAFNVAIDFWPGGITETQKQWLNEFHRIKNDNFPKFE